MVAHIFVCDGKGIYFICDMILVPSWGSRKGFEGYLCFDFIARDRNGFWIMLVLWFHKWFWVILVLWLIVRIVKSFKQAFPLILLCCQWSLGLNWNIGNDILDEQSIQPYVDPHNTLIGSGLSDGRHNHLLN